jgi:hypothetical protein
MTKRARENSTNSLYSESPSHSQQGNAAGVDPNVEDGESAAALKKARTFMATLVSTVVWERVRRRLPDCVAVGLRCLQIAEVEM